MSGVVVSQNHQLYEYDLNKINKPDELTNKRKQMLRFQQTETVLTKCGQSQLLAKLQIEAGSTLATLLWCPMKHFP